MTRSRKSKAERMEQRKALNKAKSIIKKNRYISRVGAKAGKLNLQTANGSNIVFSSKGAYVAYKVKMRKDGISDLNLLKGTIIYPTVPSEFEIQAYLFSELKAIGVDVRGEVRAKNTNGFKNILDLVIFEDNGAKFILEVKKDRYRNIIPQQKEYGNFGLPIRFIMGMKSAEAYIKRVRVDFKKYRNKVA